jgi:hypothetical protein
VFDAIALAEKGLLANPSVVEERKLNDTLNDLELKRAAIQAKLDAQINRTAPRRRRWPRWPPSRARWSGERGWRSRPRAPSC